MSFFQGTLQEGIGAAVQQGKSVVCFVTDKEAESKKWEDEYLVDSSVVPLLQSQAVTLRLEAGSQEEGFLTQLYPIPKKPTIVIIKNGELKEYIASGVSKEDFFRRILGALQRTQPGLVSTQPADSSAVASVSTPAPSQSQPSPTAESTSSASSGRATPPPPSDEDQVQSLLIEEAARLAMEKKKQEEDARKRRLEKGKAKADAPAKTSDAQSKHADILKKKQREAREERQRILKAIEDDKAARRARQAERQAERRAAAETVSRAKAEPLFTPASPFQPKTGRVSEHCSLQVRLLNGENIRSRFSSQDTLTDVRQWVDGTTGGNIGSGSGKTAYTFKILLTPLPSKTVDVTEERKSLQDLGLTPSATLILLPVVKSTGAYIVASDGGNIFSRAIAFILALINGFFGVLFSFFSTLFSTAGPPRTGPAPEPERQGTTSGRDGSRIQGVRRTDERTNDQQFYNGNSTNFEPRPNDEEEDA